MVDKEKFMASLKLFSLLQYLLVSSRLTSITCHVNQRKTL